MGRINVDPDHPDYDDQRELLELDRAERRRQRELMRHPDCRDPDHPGCEACRDDDEEE